MPKLFKMLGVLPCTARVAATDCTLYETKKNRLLVIGGGSTQRAHSAHQ